MNQPRRSLARLATVGVVVACAPPPRTAPPLPIAAASANPVPETKREAEPEPRPSGATRFLRGYVGRLPIEATLEETTVGWTGCYRRIGANETSRLTIVTGEPVVRNACPECDPTRDWPRPSGCRVDLRSDTGARRLDAICTRSLVRGGNMTEDRLALAGVESSADGGEGEPFFLGTSSYAAAPDATVIALAAEPKPPHACPPFIDLLDVTRMPRAKLAILYERSFPCEAKDDEIVEGNTGGVELRLAIVGDSQANTPSIAVPGERDEALPSLQVYELGPGVELYEVRFDSSHYSTSQGRILNETRRRLFARTSNGGFGPTLELPAVQSYDTGCAPFDYVELTVAELDGAPPAEIVVDLQRVVKPCSEGSHDPEVPDMHEYAAYRLRPASAVFERLPLTSRRLATRGGRVAPKSLVTRDESWDAAENAVCR